MHVVTLLAKKLFQDLDSGRVSMTKIGTKIGGIAAALLLLDLPSKFDTPLMVIGVVGLVLAGDGARDAIAKIGRK